MGTIVLNVQDEWEKGNRTANVLNFNPTGLCPPGRGILKDFAGRRCLDFTCAASDPTTGNSKRSEFKFADDGDPRLVGNRYYYIETYFEDYTADSSSPNSCNHSFLQWKFSDFYPQVAPWIINVGGTLKIQLRRQYSSIPTATSPETAVALANIVNLTSNTWQAWCWDILWRGDNTGHVKIYIDGSIVFNLTGIQTMDTGSTTPPPRVGPYCFGGFNSITSRTIDYRRFIIGNDDFTDAADFLATIDGIVAPPTPGTNTINEIPGIFINGN